LPAWQPILTADTVLPTFLLIGIAFIPIGVGLLISSNQVQEKVIDYTNCRALNRNQTCAEIIAANLDRPDDCDCEVTFTLDEDFQRDVFIYYGLTNFYQNHRRYVRSRDDSQLYGSRSLSKDCAPYADRIVDGKSVPIAPCGAIANSMFNDTFFLYEASSSSSRPTSTKPDVSTGTDSNPITTEPVGFADNDRLVAVFRTGIAWATDKNSKFRNPPGDSLKDAFKDYTQPPNWRVPVYELDTTDANNNGYLNEAFIVWMRTAALPTFRKLYGRIDHSSSPQFHHSLPRGSYKMVVKYSKNKNDICFCSESELILIPFSPQFQIRFPGFKIQRN
jgi:hypothetical protein